MPFLFSLWPAAVSPKFTIFLIPIKLCSLMVLFPGTLDVRIPSVWSRREKKSFPWASQKEQSLEGGDRHTHRHGWPWHQCPGPSHLPSDRLLAGGTVALGYCGNSQVLQVLLQAPQHGVQGGPVILLVGYGFLAGICFRCNLYQEKNHKESYPLVSSARPRSLPWTSSKALEESNIATPKKKKKD